MNAIPRCGLLLGIDYGDQKVGLAISSPDRKFVFGRGIVRPTSPDRLVEHLKAICSEEGVVGIIIGLPITEAGKPSSQTGHVRRIAEKIQEELRLPVFFEDERYSSKLARQLASEKKEDDEGAARLILESAIQRSEHHS